MKWLALLCLVAGALAQDQTLSLGITATATPSATLPITPPAQRSLAACSADPLWRRLRNAQGVDPCALAMNLQQMCTTIDPIPALTGGESYTGPTSVSAATPCICTTVMYNLVAGCAACQHQLSTNVTRNWVPWSTWSALCQNRAQIVDGAWGRTTQFNSTIPAWAFAKVFQSDYFNLQQAVNVGLTSTGSAPTSTSATPPAAANSSQIGAIVGGVLGGVGFILLLLTCLFCFLRRRQRKWEEQEGVNRPRESYVGKPPIKPLPTNATNGGGMLQKPYGVAGLTSPSRPDFDEKPRVIRTETALPDVLADEHRQGKPEYPMPGNGFVGGFNRGQNDYTPVPNPGVAGVGAGGRGLAPVNRVPAPVGPAGAAAQMLAHDMAAAQRSRAEREGIFREDFSASEGNGYRSSTDADGQSRNGNGNGNGYRSAYPPTSYPHPVPPVPGRFNNRHDNSGGGGGYGHDGMGAYGPDQPDEDVHAYSTVGDASISVYPSSADHHDTVPPPPFVGGFSPVPEKEREEYRLPERGYSSGYVIPGSAGSGNSSGNGNGSGGQNSPGLDTDPFAANRRPAAFNRVFGDRPSGSGAGNGRGASTSPTTATGGRGGSPVVARAGGSPILTRGGGPSPVLTRRGINTGGPHNMGFGRQQSANAAWNGQPRDSNGFSEGSSPTAVGFPGDVGGSNRDDGSPIPTAPFVGRSGYGVGR